MDAGQVARYCGNVGRGTKKEKEAPGEKLIVRNKRASFEYELGDRYEAGLVLIGTEVKMLRSAPADLTDSWCSIDSGEAWLRGVNIPEMPGSAFGHVAKRPRKLLLHANQIDDIKQALARDGMTVVATRMYFKEGRAKVELALAKGKKAIDKRESLKEKDAEREARAAMARSRRG